MAPSEEPLEPAKEGVPATAPRGRDTRLEVPGDLRAFLRRTIAAAAGNEVFFLGRVRWASSDDQPVALLTELDVIARGNRDSVNALLERATGWDVALHNHPSGELAPSDADQVIAHELGQRRVGFVILSNDAERYYLVVPPMRRREEVPVDLDRIRQVFDRGGPLGNHLEDYETRRGQLEMSLAVARALNEQQVLATEAGTGIGKSFAYLVPAILWAKSNQSRVIVSTGTIALQEQLVQKDLPFLARVLDVPFRFALIKGRGNYACRRKADEVSRELQQQSFVDSDDERDQLRSLVSWTRRDKDGSRSSLDWIPSHEVWERVMSETDKSLKVECEHYSQCFYYQAKRAASDADILVVNHHLFFADLAVRRQTENFDFDLILPRYRRTIFDEAHHIEDVASEYLGLEFSRFGIKRRLSRHKSLRSERRGTVPRLISQLQRGDGDPKTANSIARAFSLYGEAAQSIDEAFAELEDRFQHEALEGNLRVSGEFSLDAPEKTRGFVTARYRSAEEGEVFWSFADEKLQFVRRELDRISGINARAIASLKLARVKEEKRRSLLLELTAFGGRLDGMMADMELFAKYDDAERVRWVRQKNVGAFDGRGAITFSAAPVRVAEVLRKAVFDALETSVLTSATLCVNGKLDFFSDRLGLEGIQGDRFRFERHESPFDFARQVLTVVPEDLPDPGSRSYEDAVAIAVLKTLEASGGRAFVLFTSYALLRKTHERLAEPLRELGMRPYAQGEADRSDLLRRFREGRGVLFGTDSFWEGVDVKGSALECVMITRLPFRVPTEPLQEARMEELERRGRHPFSHFTIPQAVLKFRQGFGRLIRSTNDRGVVAILDRRILTKSYGKSFLRSLPETAFVRGNLSETATAVREFFEREG